MLRNLLKTIVFVVGLQFLVVACLKIDATEGFVVFMEGEKTIYKISNNKNVDDYTPIVKSVLDSCEGKNNVKIIFEKGKYLFFPKKAQSRFLSISNNDSGIKRIVFELSGYTNLEIDGGGSKFVFHGKMVPFSIQNSSNIKLHSFSVNWDSPFVLEGIVVNNDSINKSFDIKIQNNIKYEVQHDVLTFSGYDWSIGLGENIIYDPQTKRPLYNTSKYEHDWNKVTLKAFDLGRGVVRLSGTTAKVPPIGSIYADKGPHGKNRLYPALFIEESKDILLRDINIHDAGAMALISQKTENVSMLRFNVILPGGSKRMISASADATHFVNCKGTISFDSCKFENMLDDATNVHGTYQIVDSIVSDTQLALTPGHFQQNGFNLFSTGDSVALIDRNSLRIVYGAKVRNFKVVNETYFLLTLEKPIYKNNFTGHYVVENLTWKAALTMRNCSVRQNRARAVLISTTKPVLIENNYFSSMMAGIRICGDANYWFESGEVSNVIIRNNEFEDIGISGHAPQAVLQIDPIIKNGYRKDNYYHRNIIFENNIVKSFDPLIVYALSVDGLIIRNNQIISTSIYPQIFKELNHFDIINSKNVLVEGNVFKGNKAAIIGISNCDASTVKIKQQIGFSKKISDKINPYLYQN